MLISFDVDDTLVCGPSAPTDDVIPRWRRWWYREGLRRGTKALMTALLMRRWQTCVYTTFYRSSGYVRGWFKSFGIPIGGIVNRSRHERTVGPKGPSKYPPAFGIDLHVDDSDGVRLEGERHGFAVVVVSPEDPDWTSRVLEAAEERMRLTERSAP
jgi:hypothetical protein